VSQRLPLLVVLLLAGAARAEVTDLSTPVSDFSLTERSGRKVTRDDLKGKVWVASFIVTRCPDGKCPQVTQTVARLQKDLANRRDVRLVTFTTDPERDKLDELNAYAEKFDADPERWLFLTGGEEEIDGLLKSMLLRNPNTGFSKGQIDHAQKLMVIDRDGNLVGVYDGMDGPGLPEGYFEKSLRGLRRQVDKLLTPKLPAWMPKDFPLFNASLNGLAGVLLLMGYSAIRLRNVRLHMLCMLTAITVSAVFLTSYLFYHLYVKSGQPTRFAEQWPDAPAWVSYVYHAVLISHTILAIPTAPLALYVAYQGLRGRIQRHVGVARWVLPIWLYVSATGVVVYWMLYRLYPSA
jgi:protein SCO1